MESLFWVGISVFGGVSWAEHIDSSEVNITSDAWDLDGLSVSIVDVVTESFSFDDVDNNSSSLFDLDASFTIAVIVVSVDFVGGGWDKFLENFDHAVEVIEFILGDFPLFEVNSVNVSVDFSVDLVFFSLSN